MAEGPPQRRRGREGVVSNRARQGSSIEQNSSNQAERDARVEARTAVVQQRLAERGRTQTIPSTAPAPSAATIGGGGHAGPGHGSGGIFYFLTVIWKMGKHVISEMGKA